ncbi:hypothetical protein ACHAXT_005862 [Thalassiosira profunda]
MMLACTVLRLLAIAATSNAFAPGSVPVVPRTANCNNLARSHAERAASEGSKRRTNNDRRDGDSSDSQSKRPHDRTVDRRKSPALWRYDLEYSIAPAGHIATSDDDNRQTSDFFPKAPPELMSPAGGWPQLKAAVANGADAVYLGLTSYSARARAANFDPDPTLLWKDSDGVANLGEKLEAAQGGKTTKREPKSADTKMDEKYEPPEGQPASLAHAVQFCHQHRVRVYVAFNTLVSDEELHEVQELIKQVWDCGVDAVIVQDIGVAKIVKEVVDRLSKRMEELGLGRGKALDGAPLEIHASTQQTVTCADGVSFAAERANATRVVVGRELSLSEIAAISANTETEIEAFVHGALCVSYSGQCFSSEAWGGRSANRGQCAQACRLPYGLISNGELIHLSFDGGIEGIMGGKSYDNEEIQYLLSPQDLCGLEQVEGLVRAGVSCLKIEGRLKDASYVAATTRAYRQAIDSSWQKVMQEKGDSSTSPERILSSPKEHVTRSDLTHVFARGQDETHDGLTPGFFEGPQHQRLVRGRSPRHRGVHVGRVVSSNKGTLIIALDDQVADQDEFPLKRGDGIVVDRGMPQEPELGGPIYDVKFREGEAAIRFGREVERDWKERDRRSSIPMAPKGSHVWKTADSEVSKRMRRLADLEPPKAPAKVLVEGRVGEPLTVRVIDKRSGEFGTANSSEMGVLEEATGSGGLSRQSVAKAIGSLGNSQWTLSELDLNQLDEGVWCPISWAKDARRRALENLEASLSDASEPISAVASRSSNEEVVVEKLLDEISQRSSRAEQPTRPTLSVLARNYDQVDAICSLIESSSMGDEVVSEVIIDFLEVEGIRAAVSRVRDAKARTSHDLRVVVASPRIIKPGEEGIWRTLLKTEPDAILVRSTGLLYKLMQLGGTGQRVAFNSAEGGETTEVTIPEMIGDFSLNAANAIAAHELLQSGLSRITAAYDLSAHAITELATLLGESASRLEVVVHQHMPIFHTEHCVFARFLSRGDSYQDCGHVCTRNAVHLRDQSGKDNLVLADMGCRNTVFSAEAQSGAYSIDEWIKAGVGHLRIELVDESPEDAVRIVTSYGKFVAKEEHADEVWNVLETISDSNGRTGGVGVGSLRNSAERRSGAVSSTVR